MKTLTQQVKQAFNALEFSNASNLSTLTTMLNEAEERNVQPVQEPARKTAPKRAPRVIGTSHSHGY